MTNEDYRAMRAEEAPLLAAAAKAVDECLAKPEPRTVPSQRAAIRRLCSSLAPTNFDLITRVELSTDILLGLHLKVFRGEKECWYGYVGKRGKLTGRSI